ncbi:hypothetical protein [Actinocorallia longicatena]|uniref:VOC family protein n=1 Tax=Actinocorallia longicatena TaxID=111803 RepID=A0ABP6Q8F2_9ACTN
MAEVDIAGFPPGAPWWLDLTSPDKQVAQDFLSGLFGWEPEHLPDMGVNDYTVQTLPPAEPPNAMGLMPAADPDAEPLWTCFFLVRNLRTSADSIRERGGQVLMDVTAIGDVGDMTLAIDPQGAGFGIWSTRPGTSSMVTGLPGTLHMIELLCPDPVKAEEFYRAVLGTSPAPAVQGERNIGWRIAAAPASGLAGNWTPYFAVADLDASLARAASLGARTEAPPSPAPYGRTAVISGPGTAPFGLIEP